MSKPKDELKSPEERRVINAQNAQKSTGPKSPEGKARSRMNALKHGMCARVVTLPNEDLVAIAERAREFYDHYDPVGPKERFLVRVAIDATLQYDRCTRAETAELTRQVRRAHPDHVAEYHDQVDRIAMRISDEKFKAVIELKRTAEGCVNLLHRWDGVQREIETNGVLSTLGLQQAYNLDPGFPEVARLLLSPDEARDPERRAQARAATLRRIELNVLDLLDREKVWREVESNERLGRTERALMVQDAERGSRMVRYRREALSWFFRATTELERLIRARLADSRNEAEALAEDSEDTEGVEPQGDITDYVVPEPILAPLATPPPGLTVRSRQRWLFGEYRRNDLVSGTEFPQYVHFDRGQALID